jgi:hypothetical protein
MHHRTVFVAPAALDSPVVFAVNHTLAQGQVVAWLRANAWRVTMGISHTRRTRSGGGTRWHLDMLFATSSANPDGTARERPVQ